MLTDALVVQGVGDGVAAEIHSALVEHYLSLPGRLRALGSNEHGFDVEEFADALASCIAAKIIEARCSPTDTICMRLGTRITYRLSPDGETLDVSGKRTLFLPQRTSRKRLERGDVFYYQFEDRAYRWGAVANPKYPLWPHDRPVPLLWFFDVVTDRPEVDSAELTPARLLIPPVCMNTQGWTQGAFVTVRNDPEVWFPLGRYPGKLPDGRCLDHTGIIVPCVDWAFSHSLWGLLGVDVALGIAAGKEPYFSPGHSGRDHPAGGGEWRDRAAEARSALNDVGMEDDSFWAVIEAAKAHGASFEDTFAGRLEGLAVEFRKLAPERVEAFAEAFDAKQGLAYSWDLWGAAYLLGGGCSDDGFIDFRSWLISMGRDQYERALEDAESLVDVEFGPAKEQDSFFEGFAYVAMRVHEELTGRELAVGRVPVPAEPYGEPWEEDELQERFPRLWVAAENGGAP